MQHSLSPGGDRTDRSELCEVRLQQRSGEQDVAFTDGWVLIGRRACDLGRLDLFDGPVIE